MKALRFFFMLIFLGSCHKGSKIEEVDLSAYLMGISGTAVFYNPATQVYKIHNLAGSSKQTSPCSTFKIMSSYIALEEGTVSPKSSNRSWNKKHYWHPLWNKDMQIQEAFKTSCVWYYRRLIDEIGSDKIKYHLAKYQYGNLDISDWEGSLNNNETSPELKGFWIESSLKISPIEQTQVLAKIFQTNPKAAADLKSLMLTSESPIKIYGKTGMGVKNNKIATAWFVGFYEQNNLPIFFAIRLDDAENNHVEDYRTQASQYAKQIAIDIITNAKLF